MRKVHASQTSVEIPPDIGYLSPAAAAKFLSISEKSLERLRITGGGPDFNKVGHRTIRYSVQVLRDWMEARRCNNSTEARAFTGAGGVL